MSGLELLRAAYPWLYLLSVLAVLIVLSALFKAHSGLRSRLDALEQLTEQRRREIEELNGLLRELREDGTQSRQREIELAERVAMLSRQQEQLLVRDADSGPYFQAIRSAQSGASADSLMSNYGLSRHEADLVVALHGRAADARS